MSQTDQAAKGWRARVERVENHDWNGEERTWQEWHYGYQGVAPWEYEEAMRLRDALIHKFRGRSLEEAIPGEVVANRYGACYYIRADYPIELRTLSPQVARANLLSNLRLVYGVGEVIEVQLKEKGWLTLEDLVGHAKWGEEAQSLVELLDRRDTKGLQQRVWHWFPKSHPLSFSLAGLHPVEEFVLLDIETLGLFGRPIILFGIARVVSNGLEVHQWLVRDMGDERAALDEFRDIVGQGSALISYNGRAFDLPCVEERFGYYGEVVTFGAPHFDLLHFSRRAWRDQLPDCRLDTLESHLLKLRRTEHVPSALVPQFYKTYLETQNVGPLVAVVSHNQQDLVTTAQIFSELCSQWEDAGS